MRLINEEEFRYDSLTDEEKKYIFNLFKDSYLKSVGTYWSEEKFIKKTKDWLFFGDKINGFIAAKENNGIFKLIISAGSLGSVINGINELLSLNKPVWGLSNDKLKNFLVKKFNFISPNKEEILKMKKLFSDEFLANKDYIINDDGTFTFNYDDVGVSNKYFVANDLFFNKINKEKMNLSSLVNEENISPPNIPNTKNFWHGGNLDDYVDNIAHKKGRYEYGPGLYAITKYEVASKYSKGSRKLYLLSIENGNEIGDVYLDRNIVEDFIKSYVISSKRKEIINIYEKHYNEDKINASIVLNVILNEKAIKPSDTDKLRLFLLNNNIDYELVDNPFGWGETMIVLYNMAKIKNKIVIKPKDKIEIFDL
jgi:hypothetical protein